jgi:hypothetical protein
MTNEKDLSENILLEEAFGQAQGVDDANGVIKGVTLLTGEKVSLNKTFYSRAAIEQARTRYEGAKMYLDHPAKGENNRSIHAFGGIYKNLRIEENRLKGDLHLLESKREMVVGIAKMRPAGVGLSIKDRGFGVEKDGVFTVEGFTDGAVFSVDLVSEASVNKDLFESRKNNSRQEDQMDWKVITADALKKERADLVESIASEATASLVKELNEAKAKNKDAAPLLEKAEKMCLLADAGFDKEVREHVRKMIEPESINVETAKAIINGQKVLLESFAKKAANGNPKVTGVGTKKAEKEEEVQEGAEDKEKMSTDAVSRAFKS